MDVVDFAKHVYKKIQQRENDISTNAANETFTYYTSSAAANTANIAQLISNPITRYLTFNFDGPAWML